MKNHIILLLFFSLIARYSIAQCDPNCGPTDQLTFNTGWDSATGTTISIGQTDPHWRLMNVPPISGAIPPGAATPTPPDAYAITPLNSSWNVLPNSRVLSMTDQSNFGPNNLNTTQPWRFRRYFCLCQDAEVVLDGRIKADDTGKLSLYDGSGAPTSFSISLPPAPNTSNFNTGVPFSQALFLTAGTYYFEFELLNTNGLAAVATGFAVEGNVGLMVSANGPVINDEQSACCAVSVITGQKILDQNGNGVYDPGTDQTGAGFVFDLIDNSTGMIIATAQSDNFGEFEFNNLLPGSYTVRERPQWGWLPNPVAFQVTLGTNDAQHVTFLNLPYNPAVWLDCTYGGVQPQPQNTDNERGLAITTDGFFLSSNITRTFTSTDLAVAGISANNKLVSKSWDNATGALQPGAKINFFTDVDAGQHFVDNMQVLNRPSFCDPQSQSRYAAVGTVRNASNTDVFYTEFANDGTMLNYADVTSTPGFERESVSDFIELSTNELMWVGTKITAPPATRRVMLSKFDACSPTATFSHREYEIQAAAGVQNANGNSIIELATPLNGQPNAKYVLTGQVGNEVLLLFLDASLNQVGTSLAYDIDSDPSTTDSGVRIRRKGDYLYIIGNQNPGGLASNTDRVFLLKLGFLGQQGIPQASTTLYDLPGLGEEVIDMELNGFDEFIITGTCDFEDPLGSSGGFQSQQTFLMGLDEFGNQLWGKKVAFSEGSEPADLKLSQLFDEINITGTCWVNELSSFNQFFRRFDEITIRASRSGELTYNTTCTEPLLATVTTPTPFPQDFIATPFTPGYVFTPGTEADADYFVERENCTLGSGGDVICDSLMLTAQQLPDNPGNCCFSIDYQNNSPAPVYSLCIRLGGGSGAFTNVSTDPSLNHSLASSGQEIMVRSNTTAAMPAGAINDAISFCLSGSTSATLDYLWKDAAGNIICEQAEVLECSNCTADFTWTSDCCELQLMGSATGTGPYTFEWDFLCDGTVDATGQSATLSNLPVGTNVVCLPVGTNVVCLKITDATGCMATVQQTVTVVDDTTPPVINCPGNITLPTDPGECFATYSIPPLTATDDCDDDLMVSCFLTGATTVPIGPVNALPKGVTTVKCATEDNKGNFASCTYTITVVDQEPPVITCPSGITTSVAACAGGISVQFPDPMVSDNCPMVSWTYSHQSGDFFPCGTTTVTGTATDMAGNQSTCSFPVTVDCECAEVGAETISCTDVEDQFAFSVSVIDLTGSGSNGCTVSVSSPQSGITISGVTTAGSAGPGYTISGIIDVAAPPMPNNITIVVSVRCVCPDGTVHDCDFPVTLQTPCCKDISVDPQEVCENGPAVQIPLVGCNNLYDVQQVRWYVADAPCPPASWGPPFQVTSGCAPLTLSPQFHNGDICVYAEVDMGSDAGPCTTLTSNIATINLCPPISCNLSGGQAYCYTGSPITPSPLSLTLNPGMPDCSYTIEWFDPNGNLIPSATGMTSYQPPALDFTLPNTECSQSYTYTAKVTSVCGEQSCSATFRLDNDDAPVGTINLLPPDVNPLCYGEDAVLEYIPECAGDPERWDWFIRPDVVPTYTQLTSNGDRNPLYYTNRLYEDTWVKVEKMNGVCPVDEIEYFLDIIDPLTILSFTADYSPICTPASVDLEVDFDPSPAPAGCTYTIYWYQGVNLIHTSTHTSATAMYTYTPPAGVGLAGNYYCIIESDCCPQREKSNVVVLEPPMEVFATGPCYRCNCETVTLDGNVLYPIPGFNCTYQWYDNGVLIPGETGTSLTVDPQWIGPFTFEVTCTDGATTCIQSDVYTLMQCGICPATCEDNIVQNGDFETGMATAFDEDITNAAFWGGIWSNGGTTFSSADLYSNTTGVPGSLQAPTPASQGQFAGFWSRIQGGDEFREGVLNELNTTIPPNSGVYELTLKVACLFTPASPASMSVYVANGSINGGAAITSGTVPINDNFFADSWEAVIHPLTTTCSNGFQTYTYTIDSSDPAFPSSGVNSIFFTRTDGVQPGAYVALDDVCLRLVIPNATKEASTGKGSSFSIYPNPTSNRFYIEWEEAGRFVHGILSDINGSRVHAFDIDRTVNQTSVRLEQLPAGVYLIQLITADGHLATKRVIKQ